MRSGWIAQAVLSDTMDQCHLQDLKCTSVQNNNSSFFRQPMLIYYNRSKMVTVGGLDCALSLCTVLRRFLTGKLQYPHPRHTNRGAKRRDKSSPPTVSFLTQAWRQHPVAIAILFFKYEEDQKGGDSFHPVWMRQKHVLVVLVLVATMVRYIQMRAIRQRCRKPVLMMDLMWDSNCRITTLVLLGTRYWQTLIWWETEKKSHWIWFSFRKLDNNN